MAQPTPKTDGHRPKLDKKTIYHYLYNTGYQTTILNGANLVA